MATDESKTAVRPKIARLNLQLPLELKEFLAQQAAKLNTTPSKLAREFLRQGLETLKQKEHTQQLIAGYQYLARENQQLLEEFRDVDLEGWEEDDANNS